MADILTFSADAETLQKVESYIQERQLRAKITSDVEVCLHWLDLRQFSLAIIDAGTGFRTIKSICERIWLHNSACRVLVCAFSGKLPLDSLLIGAEVVSAESVWSTLDAALEEVRDAKEDVHFSSHVLVVEDLDAPRDIICMFLEGLGISKVTGVAGGNQALEALAANPNSFTTVLTDVRMPQMSGDELIRRIRVTDGLGRVPVIVLTAFGTPDCLVSCLHAGATGFLVKPPRKDDLKRELDRAERVRRSGSSVRLVAEDRVDELYGLLIDRGLA